MIFSEEDKIGLNVALNEADVLAVDFDKTKRRCDVHLDVICVDEEGRVPDDRYVKITLFPVGRMLASYRMGLWNDESADVEAFECEGLSDVTRSFEGLSSLYGWDYIDCKDKYFSSWKDRVSMEFASNEDDGSAHTIDLFQESARGASRHLDMRIWFDGMSIFDREGKTIVLQDFIARGKAGWDRIYGGGQDAQSEFSVVPLKADDDD